MRSDEIVDETKASSGVVFDPIEYHRRLVSLILDAGVNNASPLQIYEHMQLPQDPDDPTFRTLTLGQIKSHLQRFRMVFKNEGHHRNTPKARSPTNLDDPESDGTENPEKKDFLDDYDSFVDFGLDAAAARNDENHKGILGGRVVGLVSRLVMMNDGVDVRHFPKNQNMDGKSSEDVSPLLSESRGLDKAIPKLSPSEEASTLGQSIRLAIGLLEHLNNYISGERQQKILQREESQKQSQQQRMQQLGIPQDPNTQSLLISSNHPIVSQAQLLPHERPLFLSKISERGPMPLPQPPPILPGKFLREQPMDGLQMNHHHHQPHPQQQQQQQQQQQHRRERLNSYSDVSSIGGENGMVDEDLPTPLVLLRPKDPLQNHQSLQGSTASNTNVGQRLGKFFPVKETEVGNASTKTASDYRRAAAAAAGHSHPPSQPLLQPHHRSASIGSFEVPSPAASLKPLVDLNLSTTTTAPTPAAAAPAVAPWKPPPVEASLYSASALTAAAELAWNFSQQLLTQHPHPSHRQDPRPQQPQHSILEHETERAAFAPPPPPPPPAAMTPPPPPPRHPKHRLRKRNRHRKHWTQKVLLQKLRRVISAMSLGKTSSEKADNDNDNGDNDDVDGDSSVVSSLSSSSSSSSHSSSLDDGLDDGDNKDGNQSSWVPPKLFLVCRSGHELNGGDHSSQDGNLGEEDCSCCSSADCSWGILQPPTTRTREGHEEGDISTTTSMSTTTIGGDQRRRGR